jgi:hypothetical protein
MKSKQTAGSKKQSIIVQDLKTRKNPQGGAVDVFLKIGDIKGETTTIKGSSSGPARGVEGIFKF